MMKQYYIEFIMKKTIRNIDCKENHNGKVKVC